MPLASWRRLDRIWSADSGSFGLGLLLLLLAFGGSTAFAQQTAPALIKPDPAKVQSQIRTTKPDWSELTPAQQAALRPLAPAWSGISETQKRKWIALSRNYASLSAPEQMTLHGRMTEWAALSPEQRSQARLNFAQTKSLSTEEKKVQWEAYQALSPEQKKQLAAGAKPKGPGAAPAVTPIAPNKLAAVPITRSELGNPAPVTSAPRAGFAGASRPKSAPATSTPVARP